MRAMSISLRPGVGIDRQAVGAGIGGTGDGDRANDRFGIAEVGGIGRVRGSSARALLSSIGTPLIGKAFVIEGGPIAYDP